tara:strand:- start:134 stop:604 length:471 start_codon:yes stop_codon:yes gene_type:complete
MSFYNLKELNIKLIDFSILLSPLGVVKKIVTNGDKHLFEINFHNSLNLYEGEFEINKKKNLIKKTPIKIFFEEKLGYIINSSIGIIELPDKIDINDDCFADLKDKDSKTISKFLRKNIPKNSQNILRNGLKLKGKKITDPEKINILNFEGFHMVSL